MSLGKLGKQKLETIASQSNLLKQCLGLSKRCHSTDLLRTLNIKCIADLSVQNSVNYLLRSVFNVHSPLQSLCTHFISCMVSNWTVITGALVDRVLQCGFSPVTYAFSFNQRVKMDQTESEVMHEHLIKPYTEVQEHIMNVLLQRAF